VIFGHGATAFGESVEALMHAFLGYAGPSDIHDGTILRVRTGEDTVLVDIRAYDGHGFVLKFIGGKIIDAVEPEGMLLHALCEVVWDQAGLRRFHFSNWHEPDQSTARLQIVARDIPAYDVAP
jgi:hypothetical protein